MNSKYVNIYTVGLTLSGIFISLLLSQKFTFIELTIVLISFGFIMLAFKLSSNNDFNKFITKSKKYYIGICLIIPFAIFLRMQISNELPVYLEKSMYSPKSTEVKIDEFTSSKSYQSLFQSCSDNYVIKPEKNTHEVKLRVFSLKEICENLNTSFRKNTQLFTGIVAIVLGLFYFGLLIGVKVSTALTSNE